MKHFYFSEEITGEEFIVGADTLEEALSDAKNLAMTLTEELDEAPELLYWYEMTDEEAEASGLDEY